MFASVPLLPLLHVVSVVQQDIELRLEAITSVLLTGSQPTIEQVASTDITQINVHVIDARLELCDFYFKQGKSLCISCLIARGFDGWLVVSRCGVSCVSF